MFERLPFWEKECDVRQHHDSVARMVSQDLHVDGIIVRFSLIYHKERKGRPERKRIPENMREREDRERDQRERERER